MRPLEVVATLRGAVALPNGPLALDGLLAAAVAMEQGIYNAPLETELKHLDIPVAWHDSRRFHLASVGHCEVEESEQRWINRRFPQQEAQALGEQRFRSYRVDAGAARSYRLPLRTFHAAGDRMAWWCVGDRDEVWRLLQLISYVGKKRATGCGRVISWAVREMQDDEMWSGFPVMRDGMPLRNLPADHPGLSDQAQLGQGTLTYPYWTRWLEVPIAVPSEAIRQ